MTDDLPDRAVRAFEAHDAFERADDATAADDTAWFEVTTTRFDGRVTAAETDDWAPEYTLEVRAPTLSAATADSVGDAVEAGWFKTYELRLEDATMSARHDVDLKQQRVFEEAGDAVAVFVFEWGNTDHAPDIAKAIAEFVEGTYVEGVVPGYEYEPPVADLLAQASQGEKGGTPL